MGMLDLSGERILEIRKSDGSILKVQPRRIPIGESGKVTRQVDELRKRLDAKEIDFGTFCLENLKIGVMNYKAEDFESFEIDEIVAISGAIGKLREVRTEAEKKSQSEASTT